MWIKELGMVIIAILSWGGSITPLTNKLEQTPANQKLILQPLAPNQNNVLCNNIINNYICILGRNR